eukprot:scaffold240667_cov26-Tisochrysis_lutea.AAC.1
MSITATRCRRLSARAFRNSVVACASFHCKAYTFSSKAKRWLPASARASDVVSVMYTSNFCLARNNCARPLACQSYSMLCTE